jgi:hypothetical protein
MASRIYVGTCGAVCMWGRVSRSGAREGRAPPIHHPRTVSPSHITSPLSTDYFATQSSLSLSLSLSHTHTHTPNHLPRV